MAPLRSLVLSFFACVLVTARRGGRWAKPWYASEVLRPDSESGVSSTETALIEESEGIVIIGSVLIGTAVATAIANKASSDFDESALRTRIADAEASVEAMSEKLCRVSVCTTVDTLQEVMIGSTETVDRVTAEIRNVNADAAQLTDETAAALGSRCISVAMLRLAWQQLDFITRETAPLKCTSVCKEPSPERKANIKVSLNAIKSFGLELAKGEALGFVENALQGQDELLFVFNMLKFADESRADPVKVASMLARLGGDALSALIVGEPIFAASLAILTQSLELGSTVYNWIDGSTVAKQIAIANGSVRDRKYGMRYLFCRETASLAVTAAALTTVASLSDQQMANITTRLAESVTAVCPASWLEVPKGVHRPIDLANGIVSAAVGDSPRGISEVRVFDSESQVPGSEGWETANILLESTFINQVRRGTPGKDEKPRAPDATTVRVELEKRCSTKTNVTGVRARYRYNPDSWLGRFARGDTENIRRPKHYCPSTDGVIAYKRSEGEPRDFITALQPSFRELKSPDPNAMPKCESIAGWNSLGLPRTIAHKIRAYVPKEISRAADNLIAQGPRSESSGIEGNGIGGDGAWARDRNEREAERIRSSVVREPYCAVCRASDEEPYVLDFTSVRQNGAPIVGISVMRRQEKVSAEDPLTESTTIVSEGQAFEDIGAEAGFFLSRRADLNACYLKHKEAITLVDGDGNNPCMREHHVLLLQHDFRIHRSHLNVPLLDAMRKAMEQRNAERTKAARLAARAEATERVEASVRAIVKAKSLARAKVKAMRQARAAAEEQAIDAVEKAIDALFAALNDDGSTDRITSRSISVALSNSPTFETLQALKTFADVIKELNIDQVSVDKTTFFAKAMASATSPLVQSLPNVAETLSRAMNTAPPEHSSSVTTSDRVLEADGTRQPMVGVADLCHIYARSTDANGDGRITLDDLVAAIPDKEELHIGIMIDNFVTSASMLDMVSINDDTLAPTEATATGQPVSKYVATCMHSRGDHASHEARKLIRDFIFSGEGAAPAKWVLGPHVYEAVAPEAAWPTLNRYWAAISGGPGKASVTFADYLSIMQASRPEHSPEKLAETVRNDFDGRFGVEQSEGPLPRELFFRHIVLLQPPHGTELWRLQVEEEVLRLSLARSTPLTIEARESVSEHFDTTAVEKDGVTAASVMGGASRYRRVVGQMVQHGVCAVTDEVSVESLEDQALAKLLPGVDLTTIAPLPAPCDAWAAALLTKVTSREESEWPLAWRLIAFSAAFTHVNLVQGASSSADVRIEAVHEKSQAVTIQLLHSVDPTKTMFVSVAAAETAMNAIGLAGPNVLKDDAVRADVEAISASPTKVKPSSPSMRRQVFEEILSKMLNALIVDLESNIAAMSALHGILLTVPHELLAVVRASRGLRGSKRKLSSSEDSSLEPAEN